MVSIRSLDERKWERERERESLGFTTKINNNCRHKFVDSQRSLRANFRSFFSPPSSPLHPPSMLYIENFYDYYKRTSGIFMIVIGVKFCWLRKEWGEDKEIYIYEGEGERNSGNFRNELGHFTAPITADTHSNAMLERFQPEATLTTVIDVVYVCRDIFVTFSSAESFMPDKRKDLCYCNAWIPLRGLQDVNKKKKKGIDRKVAYSGHFVSN